MSQPKERNITIIMKTHKSRPTKSVHFILTRKGTASRRDRSNTNPFTRKKKLTNVYDKHEEIMSFSIESWHVY